MTQPVKASEIVSEKIEWRWPLPGTGMAGRIPKGMITVVAGKPDQGKGLFAARVAADVSRAGENVLYSAAEDSHKLMTRPRLEAAGADLKRISLWRFRVPQNMDKLVQIVRQRKIDLIVMDPLASHLSHGIRRYSDNIRDVLNPLIELVEATGASLLIVEHALKRVSQSGDPLDCIGGSSSGLCAAARAAWIFGYDPDDVDRRVLAQAKLNIDERRPAIAFEIDTEEVKLRTKSGETIASDTPCLHVDEEIEGFDTMRIFETKRQPTSVASDKLAAACEWLATYLARSGPTKSATIIEDAKQYDMSRRTLERAKKEMGVIATKGRSSVWDLPDEVKLRMGVQVTDADITKFLEGPDD